MVNKTFISLLRTGVSCHADADLGSDINWEEVGALAAKQGVLPLVFDGYQRYYEECGLQAPVGMKIKWYASCRLAERHYQKHLQAIRTLTGYLAEHGMRTMVLKGYALSLCYPEPKHRPSGDIDIYQFGKFNEADALLEQNAAVAINRTHHHHTVFMWNGVAVENHYDFVNIYTHPMHAKLDSELKRMAEMEQGEMVHGVLLPSPNLMALFTLVHSAEHFAAEGVVLRQLVDWWLLKQKYSERADWTKVESLLDELGFGRFYKAWNELASSIFDKEADLDFDKMSSDAKAILNDILCPKYSAKLPKGKFVLGCFKIRRWFGNRWKMKMVYEKESLWKQFWMHVHSHLIRPEKMLVSK